MQTIDLSKEIQAIRDKFNPNYHKKPEARAAAAALWGWEEDIITTEIIVEVGRCKGELDFSPTAKGYWLIGISAMSSFNGRGYAPSVWDSIGYLSYHDARLAGVLKLIRFFEGVANEMISTNSETNRANAKEALRILEAEKTPQLVLF